MKRYYGKDLKRYAFTLRVHKQLPVADVVAQIKDRYGVEVSRASLKYIIKSECQRLGVRNPFSPHTDELKAKAIKLGRSGRYRTVPEIINVIAEQYRGNLPVLSTVNKWFREAGVRVESHGVKKIGYPAEVREYALARYVAGDKVKEILVNVKDRFYIDMTIHCLYKWLNQAGIPRTRTPGPKLGSKTERIGVELVIRTNRTGVPQWISDQMDLCCDLGEGETQEACERMARDARLWWSRETSENPRWNPNAGKSGRLAA